MPELFDVLYELGDVGEMITAFVSLLSLIGPMLGIMALASYFIKGYALMCTGHKAKVGGDFMPFVPIARQIYQMKIAECPIWYILFFETTTITTGVTVLVSFLLGMLVPDHPAIIIVLLFIYWIANRVFTVLYYRNYYRAFGFNPNTAWMHIIPGVQMMGSVFTYLIAFSNAILYKDYVDPIEVMTPVKEPKAISADGVIVGVTGKYINAKFEMKDGAELVFGRDPQEVNIVFDQTASDVSRKHCSVRFDGKAQQYVVTDFSTTGTFLESGVRLEKFQPKTIAKGTVIYLGASRQNGFRLN